MDGLSSGWVLGSGSVNTDAPGSRAELLKLGNEIRLLAPSQPERAIQIPAFGKNQWRWRMDLHLSGTPKLPSDEFLLSIAAIQKGGQWMLRVSTQSVHQIPGNEKLKSTLQIRHLYFSDFGKA